MRTFSCLCWFWQFVTLIANREDFLDVLRISVCLYMVSISHGLSWCVSENGDVIGRVRTKSVPCDVDHANKTCF